MGRSGFNALVFSDSAVNQSDDRESGISLYLFRWLLYVGPYKGCLGMDGLYKILEGTIEKIICKSLLKNLYLKKI